MKIRTLAPLFLLLVLLLITPIFLIQTLSGEPGYVNFAHEIIQKVSKKLEARHGLFTIGDGGGMMNQVEALFIMFKCDRPLTKDQVRALIIDCSEELLQAVNAHEQIRPSLSHYPFSQKGISISIIFYDEEGNPLYFPQIANVTSFPGKICFYTQLPKKLTPETEEIEPYSEALECVRRQAAQNEIE